MLGAGENTNNESPRFAPDGGTLAVVRSTRSPKQVVRPTLSLIDLATGTIRTVANGFDAWPHIGDWSADGKRLYVTADLAGHVPVFAVDITADAVERITVKPSGGAHSDLQVLADGRIAGVEVNERRRTAAEIAW